MPLYNYVTVVFQISKKQHALMATRYQAVLDKSLAVSTKKKDEDALEEVRILILTFIKTLATTTDCINCKIDSINSNMMIVIKEK